MAKTETNVSTLKINRGTYAKVQENLSSITENELIITSDKNVPIPTTNDNGKAVVVNASGEYELGNAGISQSDADARYLKLSGGTMTGDINIDTNYIKSGSHYLLNYDSSVLNVGDNSLISLATGPSNIKHNKNGTFYDVLDASNTSANPTLSGGETTLSSLKLNGTNYAVGGSVTPMYYYQYNITLDLQDTVDTAKHHRIRCNASLISSDGTLDMDYNSGSTGATFAVLKQYMTFSGTTGYVQLLNISGITLTDASVSAINYPFTPVSYIRYNYANNHYYVTTTSGEVELQPGVNGTNYSLFIKGVKTQIV